MATFLTVWTNPQQKQLKKAMVYSGSQFEGAQSIPEGKTWWQESEAAAPSITKR